MFDHSTHMLMIIGNSGLKCQKLHRAGTLVLYKPNVDIFPDGATIPCKMERYRGHPPPPQPSQHFNLLSLKRIPKH